MFHLRWDCYHVSCLFHPIKCCRCDGGWKQSGCFWSQEPVDGVLWWFTFVGQKSLMDVCVYLLESISGWYCFVDVFLNGDVWSWCYGSTCTHVYLGPTDVKHVGFQWIHWLYLQTWRGLVKSFWTAAAALLAPRSARLAYWVEWLYQAASSTRVKLHKKACCCAFAVLDLCHGQFTPAFDSSIIFRNKTSSKAWWQYFMAS